MNSDRRVALVTGAGRRLGKHLSLALAAAGYDVILHANESFDAAQSLVIEIQKRGSRALAVQADLSRVDEIKRLVPPVREWTSQLHVLVNNAGIFPTHRFEEIDGAAWDAVMNVNLRAAFFLAQAFTPMLRAAEDACIVNVASLGAFQSWVTHVPYCISKAGIVMLTKALAKTLAPSIRVNAVAPGIIIVPDEEVRQHPSSERIPLKRYGTIEDFTQAVLYLAQPSSYLTGHVLTIDGGASGTATL